MRLHYFLFLLFQLSTSCFESDVLIDIEASNAELAQRDSDGDGLDDFSESKLGTDPNNPDSDGDGVIDFLDAFPLNSFEHTDTDHDGIGNNEDTDDDDGIPDDSDDFPLESDHTAPSSPVITAESPTLDKTPTWSWSQGGGDGNGTYRYKLDNSNLTSGATETTSTSYTPSSDLSPGLHTLYVEERDETGNWSRNGSYTIDVKPLAWFQEAYIKPIIPDAEDYLG